MLIQCPDCSELVAFDTCTCPSCGAERVCSRGGVSKTAAVLGITLATGCVTGQPVYSATVTGYPTNTTPQPTCDPIEVFFDGEVSTVSAMPLGLDDSARTETVTGSFTYLPCLGDDDPLDSNRGEYFHSIDGDLEVLVAGLAVDGSGKAIVTTENFDPDTFRFEDGDLTFATETRMMQINGADAPDLQMRLSVTDSSGVALASDAPPDPFSFDASMPHTFSLQDGGGTLLIQLDSMSR